MQIVDLEGAKEEIHRLKTENNSLTEERNFYRTSAKKYQNRAIATRKMYAEIKGDSKVTKATGDSKLRVQLSELKSALKSEQQKVQDLKIENGQQKEKSALAQDKAKEYRAELVTSSKHLDKLTRKLMKVEKDKK